MIECSRRTDPTDELLEMLSSARRSATPRSPLTQSAGPAWAYRETHTEAINAAGVPVKLDVCVPLDELSGLVAELPATVATLAPQARTVLFGHLNEGNLHVNVLRRHRDLRGRYRRGAAARRQAARQHLFGARRRASQDALARAVALGRGDRGNASGEVCLRPFQGLLNPGVLLP